MTELHNPPEPSPARVGTDGGPTAGATSADTPVGPPPRWDLVVWAGACLLTAWSLVGLGFAMAGWFRPAPVIGGTILVAVALFAAVRPHVVVGTGSVRAPVLLTAAVLVLAGGVGAWNGAHHGEHLVAERDPGVYATTGLLLADTGTLRFAPPEGPFDGAPGVLESTIGFSPNEHGSLDAQFAHLNAVFLAGAAWLGPTKLFMVPALLMAIAVVLVYALGVRFGRPWGGAFAAVALAGVYPSVYLARDTYSESVALVLLLAGLWALTFVRRGHVAPGVIAGALLGATAMARIDAYVPLIPIAGVIALEATVALVRGDRRRAGGFVAAWVTTAVCATAGALDVYWFSRSYFRSNLTDRLPTMVAAIAGATVAGAVVGRFGIGRPPRRETALGWIRWAYGGVALGVVAVVVWARWFRPDFVALREAMQAGRPTIELLPTAETIAWFWVEWYLGPLLTLGGIAALVWMTWRGLTRPDRMLLATAGVAFSTLLLYLVSPTITPDHPWAIRRFMAVPIPLLLLAVGLALAELARRRPPWSALGAATLAAVVLIQPFWITRRLAATSVGDSLATRFNAICDIVDTEPSAVLVTPSRSLAHTIPESLQGWCDVPVAGAQTDITADQVTDLVDRWRDEGRRLVLVATSTDGIAGVTGPRTAIPGPLLLAPERTIDRVPRHITPDSRVAQSDTGDLPLWVVEPSPSTGD